MGRIVPGAGQRVASFTCLSCRAGASITLGAGVAALVGRVELKARGDRPSQAKGMATPNIDNPESCSQLRRERLAVKELVNLIRDNAHPQEFPGICRRSGRSHCALPQLRDPGTVRPDFQQVDLAGARNSCFVDLACGIRGIRRLFRASARNAFASLFGRTICCRGFRCGDSGQKSLESFRSRRRRSAQVLQEQTKVDVGRSDPADLGVVGGPARCPDWTRNQWEMCARLFSLGGSRGTDVGRMQCTAFGQFARGHGSPDGLRMGRRRPVCLVAKERSTRALTFTCLAHSKGN